MDEHPNNEYNSMVENDRSLYMTIRIISNYIISDIQRKPRSFKIGLFTIYLVVAFISLVQSAFQMSPLIFLQLSETQASDTDVLIAPIPMQNDTSLTKTTEKFGPDDLETDSNSGLANFTAFTATFNSIKLINSTQVNVATNKLSSIFGEAPRWLFIGDLLNPNNSISQINRRMRCFILIIDSQKELSIGLGRRLEVNPLQNNEAYLTKSTMRGLNLTEGDNFILNLDLINLLMRQSGKDMNSQDSIANMIDEMVKNMIDSQLQALFGDDVLNITLNSTIVKNTVNDFKNIIENIDDDQKFKDDFRNFWSGFLKQTQLTPQSQSQALNIIDQFLKQNFTEIVNQIKKTVDQLPDNTTFTIGNLSFNLGPFVVDSFNFNTTLRIREQIEAARGKWADGLGNVMTVDYKNISKILVSSFKDQLRRKVDQAANSDDENLSQQARFARLLLVDPLLNLLNNITDGFNLSDYSLSTNLILKDREQIYTNQDTIRQKMISVTNDFYKQIGKSHPSQPQIPLALAMTGFLLIKNFLDNMVFSATFILLMLSTLLIYSLMIGDVEEKTYEFGMLRALGFHKRWLVVLLLFEAVVFALPGLALGMLTSYLLNSIVGMIIFSSTLLYSSYELHYSAVALAVCLGIFIPLISNVLPIFRALSKTLRDSLDLYHRVLNEVLIQVIRLEKMGISLDQTMTALLLVVMGFVSYYLAPLAFVFQNIQLFLAIINIILIIMILGFTLFVNLFQGYLTLLSIFNRSFREMSIEINTLRISKRFEFEIDYFEKYEWSWEKKQQNYFDVYYCISFFNFCRSRNFLKLILGAEITVFVPPTDKYGLDEYKIRQYMDQVKLRDPSLIRQYSFTTYGMTDFPQMPSKIEIMPLSYFPRRNTIPVGVEKQLLESLLIDYYVPNDYDGSVNFPELHNGKKDGVFGLYYRNNSLDLPIDGDIKGVKSNHKSRNAYYKDLGIENKHKNGIDREINIVLPEGLRYEVSMSVDTPALLSLKWIETFRLKVRHMATKVPGFRFSGYRQIAFNGDSLVSMEDFQYMLNAYYDGNIETGELSNPEVKFYFDQLPKNLTYGLPKDAMFVSFGRSTTKNERIDFANGLRNYFRDENTLLFDVNSLVEDAASTFFYLELFYVIVGLVAMILSFFLILVSFVSNIRENSWELGVLRAIGINKDQITRIYIYEAVCLIMASGLLGTLIGIVVAVTLTLQMLMFVELPFIFAFPTSMFLLTFLGGFFTAIFGSYFAIREIRDKSISSILKGLL